MRSALLPDEGGSPGPCKGHSCSQGRAGQLPCLLLHLAANVAELPECRTQMLQGGAAEAVKRLAAQEQQLLAGHGRSSEASVATGKAAADALRALGFAHWPQ